MSYKYMKMSEVSDFPVWGLLPKKETGVTQFLSKYPEYDGRGVVIAIFDSGVDPGAPGLQVTTDGKLKVIERYDCSGAGDVDTSTVVTPIDTTIEGLTGRTLKIPDDWNNPSGVYHIGVKNIYQLYPSKLKERIKKEMKEKLWDPDHRQAVAAAVRKIDTPIDGNVSDSSLTSIVEKFSKDDKDAELEVLNTFDKKYTDVGPTCDCVVYHDGETWRACIDTSRTGDLARGVHLGEYTSTHEYAPLTENDRLNVSINVYDNGNLLEIVGMCSPHGTHVASIAAANFPDEPEKNGVAPGAQIVSMSIGDVRLSSMETGTAMVRAMIKVMQRTGNDMKRIHVINMSYGEHAHWANSGRIGELIAEVVDKHLTTWVVSAGNSGPALSTVSTPPDIRENCLIGVGAYVSPDMMAAEYSLLEKLPGITYTWSSRSPTPDGGWVISVCAPGGAITSVPNFTLRGAQLMNGTSMAAPHVTGAVAVLMSGMLQRGYEFTPNSIKSALENSAQYLPDIDEFAQGHGLLQVEKAFEHLCANHTAVERAVRFSISCSTKNSKGIYIRNEIPDKPKNVLVNIDPIFREDEDKRTMIDFDMRFNLVCAAPWVKFPPFLNLTNALRTILVRVDPCGLPEGAHTTSIRAYDTSNVEKGPVFRIPVTVINPTIITSATNFEFIQRGVFFKPGTIKRHFLFVPAKATWATLTLRTPDKNMGGKFIIHCMQLLPRRSCRSLEYHKLISIMPTCDASHAFPCRGGVVIEIVVAKFWSSLLTLELDYEVEFRGTKPDQPAITMIGNDSIHAVELLPGVRTEEVLPIISLKQSVVSLRPAENKITACCPERDVIPPARQIFELVLTYNVSISKTCEVTPRCPLLCEMLYESEFESQLWMLFDSSRQLLAVGDAYPSKYSVKLEKGDYVIKLNVRHEKRDLLEKLSDTQMLVSQKLCQPLSLDVYTSQSQAMIHGKKMIHSLIHPGNKSQPIYINPLSQDKAVTKNVPVGHYLEGTISISKDELGKKVDVYPFKYIMPETATKKNNNSKDKDKPKSDEIEDSIREFAISCLAKLEPGEKASEWYEKLKAEHPTNLQVHIAMLAVLDPTEHKRVGVLPFFKSDLSEEEETSFRDMCKSVISICDVIISAIDVTSMLAQLATKYVEPSKIQKNAEKQKAALIEAFARKGCALARLQALDGVADAEPLNEILKELLKLVDHSDSKVATFLLWHAVQSRHYVRAVRYLSKMAEDRPCKNVDSKMAEICTLLDWKHIAHSITSAMPHKYPHTTLNRKF